MDAAAGLEWRHRLFVAARSHADLTTDQLWLRYFALGGAAGPLDLEAYLVGLAALSSQQQDVLACALNERLADLDADVRVPYLTELPDRWPGDDVLAELLEEARSTR